MSDTPETDEAEWGITPNDMVVRSGLARKLELERNESRKKIWELTTLLQEHGINDLKRHSIMLGQIAGYVSDFCDEETTTLEAVMYLKAYWHRSEAQKIDEYLHDEK